MISLTKSFFGKNTVNWRRIEIDKYFDKFRSFLINFYRFEVFSSNVFWFSIACLQFDRKYLIANNCGQKQLQESFFNYCHKNFGKVNAIRFKSNFSLIKYRQIPGKERRFEQFNSN